MKLTITLFALIYSGKYEVHAQVCCRAYVADCSACNAGKSVCEYCQETGAKQGISGCEVYNPVGEGPQIACETDEQVSPSNDREGSGGDTSTETPTQVCCRANNATCISCQEGMTVEEFCKTDPRTLGCENIGNDSPTDSTKEPKSPEPGAPTTGGEDPPETPDKTDELTTCNQDRKCEVKNGSA